MRTFKLTAIITTLFLISNINLVSIKADAATISDNWDLTWSDEFDSNEINHLNWTYDIGGHGWGNNELEYYTDRPENSRIEDGNLVIEARKESYKGSSYTSARLKTEGLQNFLYGKVEARIKLPEGQGLWPAFWMLGSNMASAKWPDCGELDIMEHINLSEYVPGTIHWNADGMHSEGAQTKVDVTKYHNYSIEWSPNYIKWFVDDTKYAEYNITDSVNGTTSYHKPFFIVLNMAVGGNWPKSPDSSTEFPAKMYVDYVRVYNQHSNASSKDSVRNAWFKNESTGSWYYLNGNGDPFKGWLYTKDYWYFLDSNGQRATGWINSNGDWYHMNNSGIMETGWVHDKGNWYYLNEHGTMLKNTTINGYTLDSNGVWIH